MGYPQDSLQRFVQLRLEHPDLTIGELESILPGSEDMQEDPWVMKTLVEAKIAMKQANTEDHKYKLARDLAWDHILKIMSSREEKDTDRKTSLSLKLINGKIANVTKLAELRAIKEATQEEADEPYPDTSGPETALAN